MTQRLDELVTFVSDDLGLEALAARLGPIVEHEGNNVELRTLEPWLASANISLYPEGYAVTGKPYLVEIVLAEPIALETLRGLLGEFYQARTSRGLPREAVFGPRDHGRAFKIVVIAHVEEPGELAIASTSRLSLRRDPQ